jgi:hypothetical protein
VLGDGGFLVQVLELGAARKQGTAVKDTKNMGRKERNVL